MTLKAKLGDVSGTRQTPTLPITVFDDAFAPLGYDAALAFAIASAPASVYGGNLRTADVGISQQSSKCIVFEMRYERPNRNILLREVDAQTDSKKITHYIAPVTVRDAGGDASSLNQSLKWKTDRPAASEEFNSAKPITVDPLRNSRRLRYSTDQSFVTDSYLDTVEDLVERGAFNSTEYLGRPIGTLQLVQFSVAESDFANWGLAFGFGYRKIQTNIDVGNGVTIPTLRGCDHYWLQEEQVYEDGKLQPKTKQAIVGQAWPLEDFSVLNMPYPGRLTTRTTDIAGTISTVTGHGISGSDDVIIWWDGGEQIAICSGVSGSSPNSAISFTSGTGDALPPLTTPCLIAKYIP